MNELIVLKPFPRLLTRVMLALSMATATAAETRAEAGSDLSLNDLMGITITTVSKRKEKPSEA